MAQFSFTNKWITDGFIHFLVKFSGSETQRILFRIWSCLNDNYYVDTQTWTKLCYSHLLFLQYNSYMGSILSKIQPYVVSFDLLQGGFLLQLHLLTSSFHVITSLRQYPTLFIPFSLLLSVYMYKLLGRLLYSLCRYIRGTFNKFPDRHLKWS